MLLGVLPAGLYPRTTLKNLLNSLHFGQENVWHIFILVDCAFTNLLVKTHSIEGFHILPVVF